MFPIYVFVWFEGSDVRRAAVIYGTTSGQAVCMMEVPDARDILKSGGMTKIRRVGNFLVAHDPSSGEDFRLPVVGNEVLFDGSLALRYEWSMYGEPSPIRPSWRKLVNLD